MAVVKGVVEQTYTIHATPATVFRFFTDPARFVRWWAAPGGGTATIDPREGGDVTIEYRGGTVMRGKVLQVTPNSRFVFTWGYEGDKQVVQPGSSRVEITLKEVPEGTLLTLRHSDLPTPEQQSGHDAGWRHYMSVMAGECAKEQFEGVFAKTIEAYVAAWNAKDPAETARLLEACAEPGVEFRDLFACIVGRDSLAGHIANVQKHVPGHELILDGKPTLCHAFVRMPWRAMRSGAEMSRGHNFCRLAPSGKLAAIVGFWDGGM
jgi:uncharacterized protein YndB with AHSA1/START domain